MEYAENKSHFYNLKKLEKYTLMSHVWITALDLGRRMEDYKSRQDEIGKKGEKKDQNPLHTHSNAGQKWDS